MTEMSLKDGLTAMEVASYLRRHPEFLKDFPDLALTLHVGPVEGPVRVLVDGTDHSVTLSRDETRRIEISIGPHRTLVPVIVQAAGGFRPSDHEPGSTDRRWLGCHVRVELE